MKASLVCVGLIALWTGTALAASTQPAGPPTTSPSAGIATLLEQLSSDDWNTRQHAQDQLVLQGEEARGPLQKLLSSTGDEEVRTRVGTALRQIDEEHRIGVSRITLHYKEAAAHDVFTNLARQAGVELSNEDPQLWGQLGAISIDVDDKPFPDVLHQLCLAAHVYPGCESGKLTLSDDSDATFDRPMHGSGPFLILADQVVLNKTVALRVVGNRKPEIDFSLQCVVIPEPKLRVLSHPTDIVVDEAVDEKGHSLVAGEPNNSDADSMNSPQGLGLAATLQYPADAGKRIAKFKGHVSFLVQTRCETLEIPDVLNAGAFSKTVGGAVFSLTKARKSGRGYEILMSVKRGNLNDAEWERMGGAMVGTSIQLVDSKGVSFRPHGVTPTLNPEDRLDVKLHFSLEDADASRKLTEPMKLTMDVPVEAKEIKIPIEFNDLPIP